MHTEFDRMIDAICAKFFLTRSDVIAHLQEMQLVHASSPVARSKGKRSKKESDSTTIETKCTGLTKAGQPCRYKVLTGTTMCKKHQAERKEQQTNKVPQVHDLPVEQQQWFLHQKQQYQQSFFPGTIDHELVDDTQFVTDE